MRSVRRALVTVCGLIIFPAAAFAQATLAGTVRDPSGAVLPGVTIEASSPVLIEKTRAATTDAAGQYRIESLQPGTYTVTFTLAGFATLKRDDVIVSGTGVVKIDAGPERTTLQFVKQPPFDAGKLILLVQRDGRIRFAGPDRIRIGQAAPTAT